MATDKIIEIPGRLKSVAIEGQVAGADQIFDDSKGKKQSDINNDIEAEINNIKGGSTDSIASLKNAINTERSRAEGAEGNLQTAINSEKTRAEGVEATKANFSDVYTRAQGSALEGSVSRSISQQNTNIANKFNAQDTTIANKFAEQDEKIEDILEQNIEVVDALPESGTAGKIYRVPDAGGAGYTDYMYQNNTWKQIADYTFPGADEEPNPESSNFVTSRGIANTYGSYIDNPEYLTVTTDSDSKILQGIKSDGTSYIGGDLEVEGQIINSSFQEQIDSAVESMQQTITDNFSNIDHIVDNPDNTQVNGYLSEQSNPEWLQVTTDNEGKVLGGRKHDGTVVENCNVEYPNGIPREIQKYVDNKTDNIKIEISPLTSDKIVFYGCSYTESAYAIKNKSWLNKLSNLLDLPLMNFGVSGNRIIDESKRLREGTNPYGTVSIKELNPTYIAIQNIGNETLHIQSNATLELYTAQAREMIENVKAIGATPILGTDYHIDNNAIDVQFKNLADSLGILYCPIGSIAEKFARPRYEGFWIGGHPATRTNEETVEEWYHQLKNLKVQKSVKLFRVRDEFALTVERIEDLNYDTLKQRLRKYIEINCGERALSETDDSWKHYDSLNEGSYTRPSVDNEYSSLIAGGQINFNNYALIEFISPKIKCKAEIIIPSNSDGLKFYLKNANVPVEPYSNDQLNGVFFVTKEVWESFSAVEGEEFTCIAGDSTTYNMTYAGKIKGQEFGGYILVFNTETTINSYSAGTLTRVSTSESIAYLQCSLKMSRYDYSFFNNINKPTSNFEEVEVIYENGAYKISVNDYKYWEYDKLRLIVYGAGNFALGAPICEVIGGDDKTVKVTTPTPKKAGLTELCEQTGFGNTEYNNIWSKDEGIIYSKMPSDILDYPQFNTDNSHVVLTEKEEGFSNRIYKTFAITSSRGYRKMYIKVITRLFPKIYNQTLNDEYHTTVRQITPTSNDYGTLICSIQTNNIDTPAICEAFVGPGWGEKYFEILVPPFVNSIKISLYRNANDFMETEKLASTWPMQVCDISVSI